MGLSVLMSLNLISQVIFFIIVFSVAFFLAKVSLSDIKKPLRYMIPIVIGFIVFTPFIVGKTPLFSIGILNFYSEGLNYGVFVGLRFLILFTTSFTFVYSTHPRDLVQALAKAGLPYTIAHAFEIAFAALPVMDYETRIISYSQQIRQVGKGKNFFSRNFEQIFKLLITLFIRGIKHAEILAIAMNSRGYGAYEERHYMDQIEYPRSGKLLRYIMVIFTITYVAFIILGGYSFRQNIRTL
jgi:energy-coupling factor transport system permease protein